MNTKEIHKEVERKLKLMQLKFFSDYRENRTQQIKLWSRFCNKNNIKNSGLGNLQITLPINKEFYIDGIACKVKYMEVDVLDAMRINKKVI